MKTIHLWLFLTFLCMTALGAAAQQAPVVVNAGADTVLYKNQTRPDSIFLNGSLSATGQAYHWELISGTTTPQIQTPDAMTSWVTGTLAEGFYQFKLTVNGTTSDTVVAFLRDWQKRGIYPCRAGYDPITKTGGQKITLEPNFKGSYIKADGTTGTWNEWNFITDVRGYVQSTKKITLSGGDTLLMEGADSTVWVELGGFGGDEGCPVYLMPHTKPVRIRGANAFFRIATRDSNVAQYVVVDGTALRSAGYPYGFLFDNTGLAYAGNGAFSGGWVANFTLKGLHSIKTNAFKIKQDPTVRPYSRYDKWIQRNILITDNWIDSSSVEGMYIGSSASDGGQTAYGWPIRMQNVSIVNNLITNCKWDGIQLANAKTGNVIKLNLIYKAGTANQSSQRAGILFGGNTTGEVDSNLVINSKGNGVQVFGYDAVNVYNNIIDSINGGGGDQDGMYQSFIPFVSEPNNTPLSVYNYGNLIGRVERSMIRVANNNGQMLPGRTHHNTFISATATDPNTLIVTNVKGDVLENNTIIKTFPYTLNSVGLKDNGVALSVTQADTTQTFTTIKATVDWLFGRLKSVSADNTPPVVDAGADTTIMLPLDSVRLTGRATDVDGGSITKYQWTIISGPAGAVLVTPNAVQTLVKNLTQGQFNFELAVTDNGNLTSKDTIQITVLPPPNILPTANAGADQFISLPANSVTLSGTAVDADGTIAKTQWTKIAGTGSYTIQNAAALQTTVGNLQQGIYDFELRVTDNRNGTTSDTVRITVNAPPVVNAGTGQSITLPASSVSLQGVATDNDGTVSSYSWTEVSGPSQASITNANAASTTVTGLITGSYIFRLTATDNSGASAMDDVAVTVNNAPVATTKTINVNIYGGSNAYANSAWNNWSIKAKSVNNATSGTLKYSDGSISTISATLSNSSNIADNGTAYGGSMAPAQVLRYTSYYTSTRTLTLKGLATSKKYSIELYASRNVSGSSTIFTINGVSQTIATYNNLTNKATFTGLTPNTSGQIVISIAKSGSYNCINGFAITESSGATTSTQTAGMLQVVEEQPELTPTTAVELFPNPAKDVLTLKLNNSYTGKMKIDVAGSSGGILKHLERIKVQTSDVYEFSVADLPAGVYVLHVQIGTWSVSRKFVKL